MPAVSEVLEEVREVYLLGADSGMRPEQVWGQIGVGLTE